MAEFPSVAVGEMGVPTLQRSQNVLDIWICLVAKPVESAAAATEAIGADTNGTREDAEPDEVCTDAGFEALAFDEMDVEA